MAELSGNQLILNPRYLNIHRFYGQQDSHQPIRQYKIVVRATDKLGKVQIVALSKPFPVGATGFHTIEA